MRIGALGAAAGASVGWTSLAMVNALLPSDGGAWFFLYLTFAVAAAFISGAAAAVLIWWTETRAQAAERLGFGRAHGAAGPTH